MPKVFLTAEWRQLLMLNYAVERDLLAPLVPPGVELDEFDGVCYVSVVGFLFLRTRIFGVAFPFHHDFEEVNLRFYVRQRGPEGWRRGVVFVQELVPRRAIAFLARTIYGEPYSAVPMAHEIAERAGQTNLRYEWQRLGRTEFVAAQTAGEPGFVRPGSLEECITGVTTRLAGAPLNTRSSIRRGGSGAPRTSSSTPTCGRFTAPVSLPRWPPRPPLPSSPKARKWSLGAGPSSRPKRSVVEGSRGCGRAPAGSRSSFDRALRQFEGSFDFASGCAQDDGRCERRSLR
ncbi:MAG: DUF2071 domain-containing protein [Chthoniobacterales bacterium]